MLQATFGPMVGGKSTLEVHRFQSKNSVQKLADLPFVTETRISEDQWLARSEDEMFTDFDGDYLWRGVLLSQPDGTDHDLCFFFHHCVSDGLSNAYMVRDLLEYYCLLAEGKEPEPAAEPLLPPVDEMLMDTSSDEVPVLEWEQLEQTAWPIMNYAPLEQRRTRLICQELPREQLEILVGHCRQEGTSINGLLMAVLLQSMALEWFGDFEHTRHLKGTSAISLRPVCDPPVASKSFGCYAMALETIYSFHLHTSVWDLARQCKQRLTDQIEQKKAAGFLAPDFTEAQLQEFISSAFGQVDRSRIHPGGVGLSNLGALPFDRQIGPFELTSMYFTSAQTTGYYAMTPNFIGLNGSLFCSFNYCEPLVSKEAARRIADTFFHKLGTAI